MIWGGDTTYDVVGVGVGDGGVVGGQADTVALAVEASQADVPEGRAREGQHGGDGVDGVHGG